MSSTTENGRGDGNTRRWMRRIALAASVVLTGAAIALVIGQREVVADALDAVSRPDPRLLALLGGSVVANLVLTALLLRLLLSRHGRVGAGEMLALISAATLFNFVPFKPGLFGRIAYHRAVNGIAATDTVRTMIQAAVLSTIVAGGLVAGLAIAAAFRLPPWSVAVGAAAGLAGLAAWPAGRFWSAAAALRGADVLVWAVRYDAAFRLIGTPIDADAALAFACVSTVVMLVPLFGNGLGVREWAIGLSVPVLTPHVIGLGLTADLVNRAAELVVVTIVGVAGIVFVGRRIRSPGRPS